MTSIQPDIPDAGRYSVKQTASILGVSRDTIYDACSKGRIKFGTLKFNSRRFITGAEIKRVWKDQA